MTRGFAEKIINSDVPLNYRDPQEFIFGEERSEKSDVYSYGMYFFREICGRDYFDCCGVPEDEMFMMADTESEQSVIDEKFIPENYNYISELLKNMTVYRREMRISLQDAVSVLKSFDKADTDSVQKTAKDKPAEKSVNKSSSSDYSVEPEYDYGIILNNRRSGRIEFRPLLFSDGRTEKYTVPVTGAEKFVIAVSKRHRDFSGISNPSSVYGDNIIPVGLAFTEYINSQKTEITVTNCEGKLKVNFSGTNSEAGWC